MWLPADRVLIESSALLVALLLETSCCVASKAEPSINMMVPVGAPALLELLVTVAVKVKEEPYGAGFSEEVTEAVVATPVTIWVREALLGSPVAGV